MGLLNTYSLLLSNWLNGGNFSSQRRKMSSTDIVPSYNLIFTKSHVKKVYRIVGIKPENHDMAFTEYIRSRMFELNPNVECMVSFTNHPINLNINSEKFQRSMSRANDAYSNYREVYESQSGLAKLTGRTYKMPGGGRLKISKERLNSLYQTFLSHYELYNKVSSGGTVVLTEIFIEIVGKDVREVKRAGTDLLGILGAVNIVAEEVKGVLKTYLHECGLATPPPLKLNKKFLPQLLFTEGNLTAFTPYRSRGLVGGKGLLLGMDFRSRLPFSVDIFAAPSAEVFLLFAKTGAGKTYAAFQMALSALALGEYVTAIDIKGREWSRIAHFTNAKILTFDSRSPSFVNTLRLDDLDINNYNASEMFDTAVTGTVNLLMLIVNLQQGEGNPSDLEIVLREAVMKLYSMRGVSVNNPASFTLTGGMKYSDILPVLEDLSLSITYTEEQRNMVRLARSRCHSYIGESGIFAEAFRNEVSLRDILDSKLVIYEFNKNQNAMVDSLDVIRVYMVQYLDSKKKAMLRERGKFLFAFYEELQRCDQFGNLLSFICGEVTGSRSNNAVVVLLLNSLKVLQGQQAQDIRSNITSFLVGAVEPSDIRTIREEFNQDWLAHQLELFEKHPNHYRNCFAGSIDTGIEVLQTVYKVQLPEHLRAQFQTRTTKTDVESV